MKNWTETGQVLDRLAELRALGQPAALATVVSVRGSTYRRPGAKLLVAADGTTTGNVSGGCLEHDVREVGLRVLRSGRSEIRRYCSGTDEIGAWDLGLGCVGQVEVYVEPAQGSWGAQHDLLDHDESFVVATVISEHEQAHAPDRLIVTALGQDGSLGSTELDAAAIERARAVLGAEGSVLHELSGRPVFLDLFLAPPQLILIGAGEDARPLARLASEVGFRIVVVDWRGPLLDPERFPRGAQMLHANPRQLTDRLHLHEQCYAVLVTHNFAADGWYLRPLVDSAISYIGILGPRQRTERLVHALEAEAPLDNTRIYGPVGLDLGTEGSEQVALSIISEILTVRSGRSGISLRNRHSPIHAPAG